MITRSPYNLLQEIYIKDKWKILVCNIFLNQTTRKQVDMIRDEFFDRWPNAKAASEADPDEMRDVIKILGFGNKRSRTIIRMSEEFHTIEWKNPKELHGLGQYAQDSWDIFINGKIKIKPTDKVLKKYLKWRNEIEKSKKSMK
jgi:methyl-CpG-binding domain protein 4